MNVQVVAAIVLSVFLVVGKVRQGDIQKQMFTESCKVRKQNGLQMQILDKQLCEQADKWAQRMASTGNFRHGGGEQIIARGYSSPKSAISAWMRSPGHRNWILCRKSHVGFGFARSKNGHPYYVGIYRNKNMTKNQK